jgi:hypothetical protein
VPASDRVVRVEPVEDDVDSRPGVSLCRADETERYGEYNAYAWADGLFDRDR